MVSNRKNRVGASVVVVLVAVFVLAILMATGCGSGTEDTTTTQAITTTAAGNTTTSAAPSTDTTAASTAEPVAVTEWEIPMLSVLTGPVAFAGTPALWGAQYAAKMINDAGGIRGVPVKVTGADTAFDPAKAATEMTSAAEKSLIVFGPMDAPGAEAVVPIITEAKVPCIGAFTTPMVREASLPWGVAYMSDAEPQDALAVAKWLGLNPDFKKLVVFYDPSDPSNTEEMRGTVAAAEAAGATLVGTIEIKSGQLDLGTPAIKALSYKADGYLCLLRMEEFAKLAIEFKNRGMTEGKRLYAPFAVFGSELLNLAQGSLEGAYIWNKMDVASQAPGWLKLREAYKADYSGQEVSIITVLAYYDMMMAVKQIYEEQGITGDPAKLAEERQMIADAFADGAIYEGLQFQWHWENGELKSGAFLFQVQGDKFVMVSPL
jgi:branched-chain amino acid transport system substrate-binding protein